jgi:hypothetical protein
MCGFSGVTARVKRKVLTTQIVGQRLSRILKHGVVNARDESGDLFGGESRVRPLGITGFTDS